MPIGKGCRKSSRRLRSDTQTARSSSARSNFRGVWLLPLTPVENFSFPRGDTSHPPRGVALGVGWGYPPPCPSRRAPAHCAHLHTRHVFQPATGRVQARIRLAMCRLVLLPYRRSNAPTARHSKTQERAQHPAPPLPRSVAAGCCVACPPQSQPVRGRRAAPCGLSRSLSVCGRYAPRNARQDIVSFVHAPYLVHGLHHRRHEIARLFRVLRRHVTR